MMLPLHTCTSKNFCFFHKDKGHDTKDYFMLKKEIERLTAKGYLKQLVKGHAHMEQDRRAQPIYSSLT